jgi:glutaredoxin
MRQLTLAMALLLAIAGSAYAGCGKSSVSLYGAYWCGECQSAKRFLSRHNVSYRWIEVTGNRQAQQSLRKQFGMVAVPAVVIDGRRRLGFNKGWVSKALCLR